MKITFQFAGGPLDGKIVVGGSLVTASALKKAISVGDSPAPSDVAPVELAAYTMIANLLLNLDEVITKKQPRAAKEK